MISPRMDPVKVAVCTIVRQRSAILNQYLLEASSTNTASELIERWRQPTARYLRLADGALTLLCLANGSSDVQRTFSKLRYVQRPDRSRMKTDKLRMEIVIMYVNKDERNIDDQLFMKKKCFISQKLPINALYCRHY